METLSPNSIFFLVEQDGEVERKFKSRIRNLLSTIGKKVRAYLVRASYGNKNDSNVVLCFKTEFGEDLALVKESTKIFKKMFSVREHIDILFLNNDQEFELRKVCCPFYVEKNYQVSLPDFYLTSSEGYGLDKIRSCFKRKKLHGSHHDGYILCDIVPSILGQKYGLGGKDIEMVILASRHEGFSLFPITKWPAYVHVAIVIADNIEELNYIDESHIKLIGWGEIYKNKDDIVV